jgi:hypothetical protein
VSQLRWQELDYGGSGDVGLERSGILALCAHPATAELLGRKLAVSFHIVGESGPMTWHAKALTTSYLTAPGAGAKSGTEDENAFPFSTASWYFLDALDMMAPADARDRRIRRLDH